MVQAAQGFFAYLDRSYYTTEPIAVVVCRTDERTLDPTAKRIVATDADGRVLASHPEISGELRFGIPIGELLVGRHPITVSVLDGNDLSRQSQELHLWKRVPKPGCEWKIDQINRVILRNGEPFFPHGILGKPQAPAEEVVA